ncbi:MAG TPA: FHA domain-containing protein [Vicinamibacteria bacterium]|nr:FHA domain-containing protein [Vicinamibacteria bacterium]
MAPLRLVPASGTPVEVDADTALVGRDPTCDVVVADGSVSRRHAHLERRGAEWAVVDQGSANGTFLDSQRITESVLHSGQELRFGAIAYRVEIDDDDDVGATVVTSGMPEVTVIQSRPLAPPPSIHPPPPPAAGVPPPLPPRGMPPPPPPPPRAGGGFPPGAPMAAGGFGAGSPVPSMAPPPAAPKKGRSPVFWIGAGCCGCLTLVLLVFGLVGGAAVFATRGAVEVVHAQITLIKKGDMGAAYRKMSDNYRQSHTEADFTAFVARHPGLKENSDSTFSSKSIVNDKGHLEGYLMAASGAKETVTYELTKQSGDWKIDDIKFEGEAALSAAAGGGGGGGSGGGGEALKVETVDVTKESAAAGMRVGIKIRVTGFSVNPDGDSYRMDLAEDLETLGPDGQSLAALSRMGLETLREKTAQATGGSAEFTNTLNFTSPTPGSYVARLTIRDNVGQNLTTHDVRFDLP